MIAHYVWPEGLAVVVEAASGRAATVFEPTGWRHGDPRLLLPDGPPPDADSVALSLPSWLTEAIVPLDVSLGGLHTEFVNLGRMISRLQAAATDGVLLVLGPRPVAAALKGGALRSLLPDGGSAAPAPVDVDQADGWILFLNGSVEVPRDERDGAKPVEPVETSPPVSTAREGPSERYLIALGALGALPEDVRAAIVAEGGEAGMAVPPLLDGNRSLLEVAQATGLREEQVMAIVRLLAARKLAFRYVARARAAARPGARE
ncbi:MAG: hypothetical protein QN120_12120 [Armatimonadota bacterium]|nr:hypothetical protein [Armatimonadota bacterium]